MTDDSNSTEAPVDAQTGGQGKPLCGVVRPIADSAGYPLGHWLEVHQIIFEAAEAAGYHAKLVSDSEAIGVILGNIVSNLHDLPIAVVDVSGLNPNVMFELGMRLAFDKPTVVIKDTLTNYPFDTSPLQYLSYPSELRHAPLMKFRKELSQAIAATADAAKLSDYRSFLSHFGSLKPGKLGDERTADTSMILDELRSLRSAISKSSEAQSMTVDAPKSLQLAKQTAVFLVRSPKATEDMMHVTLMNAAGLGSFGVETVVATDGIFRITLYAEPGVSITGLYVTARRAIQKLGAIIL